MRIRTVWLALGAMAAVQLGASLAVQAFDTFGVAGTTWLRLTVAAVFLLVVAFPREVTRQQLGPAALLGVSMAGSSVLFASATDRVPLGVAVAVEFCGPLGVAVATSMRRGAARLLLPLAALTGVVLLTEPWSLGGSGQRWVGLACAAGAGACWACYIVLTAKVGQVMEGVRGLSVAVPVAAALLTPIGLPGVLRADGDLVTAAAWCVAAALLVPLSAFALEMTALRTMPPAVFGTWMSLEPAFGVVVGLAVLSQPVHPWQVPGFALVVLAGVVTQRLAGTTPAASAGPEVPIGGSHPAPGPHAPAAAPPGSTPTPIP
jgi:inner membrane transporter RhtA